MDIETGIINQAKKVLAEKHAVSETDLDYIGPMLHLLLFNVMDERSPSFKSTIAYSMKEPGAYHV